MLSEQDSLKFRRRHSAFNLEEHKIRARGIHVNAGNRRERIVKPADVADEALACLVVLVIGGRKERQKILRQRIYIPGGNELPHVIQDIKILTVAITQAESRNAAVFAHAANQKQVGKAAGDVQQAGNGFTRKVDERFIDDYEIHVLGL